MNRSIGEVSKEINNFKLDLLDLESMLTKGSAAKNNSGILVKENPLGEDSLFLQGTEGSFMESGNQTAGTQAKYKHSPARAKDAKTSRGHLQQSPKRPGLSKR